MADNALGTESNPIITDAAPLSPGIAVVIGTAGSAIVLSQTVIGAWRRVSLSQIRGLYYARMHVFFLVLCVVASIGAAGAFHFFPDDARALGGLLPALGVLAPFVFIARRPQDSISTTLTPSRARFMDWLSESPVNMILMLPGIALSALCLWGMVEAQSWDVLALSFSVSVAVLTRSDPPLYFAWDGVAPRWQWGRLLPCPTRMPAWRLVVGRVEDENGQVDVSTDAMEVPVVDSRSMQGGLIGESDLVSDRTLARELKRNGAHRSLPHFYEYVDRVWQELIHGASKGDANEGMRLDEAAASCFFLIVTMLRHALQEEVTVGADVWLLLAILRHRLEAIAFDFVSMSNWKLASRKSRIQDLMSSTLSTMAGRRRGTMIVFDDGLVDDEQRLHSAQQEGEEGQVQVQGIGIEGNEEPVFDGDSASLQHDVEDGKKESLRVVEEYDDEKGGNPGERRFILKMFQAFASADDAPDTSDVTEWVEWVLGVLGDLYRSAIDVSKRSGEVGQKQVMEMEETFRAWLGEREYEELSAEIAKALEADAPSTRQQKTKDGAQEFQVTQAQEGTAKVAREEAWSFVMLALAREHITTVGRDDEYAFESFGGDLPQGELNGRLKAQNIARKIVLAQVGLWAYVALGQTATALLSR